MDAEKVKVVLVGVDYYRDKKFEYYMEELANLADACGYEIVGKVTQKLSKIDGKHYLGSGKIIELKDIVEDTKADLIILNNEIGGMQNRNIEKICECPVMDRTQLILEIFASRVKTKEAQLQVSIAQLKYFKPRMVGNYDNLNRQGGGKAGTIARGSGEKKIELDRRKIDNEISLMEKELKKFVQARQLQRQKRKNNNIPIVAVVGYTNAGKSTLLNALVADEKQVFAKNMLFATLDTAVRKITLPNNQTFLLVDTVGFVSNLPTELVKAFRSTLEEIETADLIIHLTDVTDPDYDMHKLVVQKTLSSLDIEGIPQLPVNNKIDQVENYEQLEGISISAKLGTNIDELLEKIRDEIFNEYKKYTLELGYDKISLIAKFQEYTYVSEPVYEQEKVLVEVILSPIEYEKYKELIKK